MTGGERSSRSPPSFPPCFLEEGAGKEGRAGDGKEHVKQEEGEGGSERGAACSCIEMCG